MDAARTLRNRMDELRERVDSAGRDDGASAGCKVVELTLPAGKTWPATGQTYWARNCDVSGPETEGAALVFAPYGDPFEVRNIGAGRPPSPATAKVRIVATLLSGEWLIEY